MNRLVDRAKRAELLDRIVNHALATGATTLALRPTAAAVGTSARMLVHHFKSRDALAAEVLLAIETRLVRTLGEPAAGDAGGWLRGMWAATATPSAAPLVRAAFEIWGRALVSPDGYGDFLDRAFAPWRDALAAMLTRRGIEEGAAHTPATLAVAAFLGLQLARLTTGDDTGPRAALELMVAKVLETGGSP